MTSLRRSPEKIRLPAGFSFSAVAAGIKVSGRPDLAAFFLEDLLLPGNLRNVRHPTHEHETNER